ncbi:hypothetical protein CBL_09624 [Carabus blaptoides fortunei]
MEIHHLQQTGGRAGNNMLVPVSRRLVLEDESNLPQAKIQTPEDFIDGRQIAARRTIPSPMYVRLALVGGLEIIQTTEQVIRLKSSVWNENFILGIFSKFVI